VILILIIISINLIDYYTVTFSFVTYIYWPAFFALTVCHLMTRNYAGPQTSHQLNPALPVCVLGILVHYMAGFKGRGGRLGSCPVASTAKGPPQKQ